MQTISFFLIFTTKRTPRKDDSIGILKPNTQNIQTFILWALLHDYYQILHYDKDHQVLFAGRSKMGPHIQADGRPPSWKSKNRDIFTIFWSIFTKFCMVTHIGPQTLMALPKNPRWLPSQYIQNHLSRHVKYCTTTHSCQNTKKMPTRLFKTSLKTCIA